MSRIPLFILFQLSWCISYNLLILHQHSTQTHPRCITIYYKLSFFQRKTLNRCSNKLLLQFLETVLALLWPNELLVLLCQLCHRWCNLRESLYKVPVIACQPKKTPHLWGVPWPRPISHRFHLGRIHLNPFRANYMPKKIHLWQPKFTLLKLGI